MKEIFQIFLLLFLFILPATTSQARYDNTEYVKEPSATVHRAKGSETNAYASSRFAIRANMLRWTTLTPDIGFEWHVNSRCSALVTGTWTSWRWKNKERRYALFEISPEMRCYMGNNKSAYLGSMLKIGEFNYKFSEYGKQGDIYGGCITGGYLLKLSRRTNLDFGLALGYIHAKYDRYHIWHDVRIQNCAQTKSYWGICNIGISLLWNLK